MLDINPEDNTNESNPELTTASMSDVLDVRARLANLRAWQDAWEREEAVLAQRAEALDPDNPIEKQRGYQITARLRRLRLMLVKEPIEISLETIKKFGYANLRTLFVEQFATLTVEERKLWLNNYLFILTPDLRELSAKLAKVRGYRSLGQQRCFLLGGPSGMGKTTFLDWFAFRQGQIVGLEYTWVPIVKVDAPTSQKSPKTLLQRIVLECGAVHLRGDNEEDLLMKIALYFQRCRVEVLIVDEVEHIQRPDLRRRLLEISNMTRGVPIICASCHPLRWIEGDAEVQGRWNDFFELKQYTRERLSQLLAFIELFLPFTSPSFLAEYKLPGGDGPAKLIEGWTGGILRDIMCLILDASMRAIQGGHPALTPSLLEAAWRDIQTKQVTDFLEILDLRKNKG